VLDELNGRIGVITPYKSQVKALKDELYPRLRAKGKAVGLLEINTVDAYQGREKDIIIISCVRASQDKNIGFLSDFRRMNVAITRAKHFLWVVGNGPTLKRNQHWGGLITHAKTQQDSYLPICTEKHLSENFFQEIHNKDRKEEPLEVKKRETKEKEKKSSKYRVSPANSKKQLRDVIGLEEPKRKVAKVEDHERKPANESERNLWALLGPK